MNQIEINKTYCCDNLKLMRNIPDNFIDLIYCDILYGTGRNFGDYQDIKADKDIINEFYIPRIKEMHRVLKDTGSIYIHCDWRINHWIRCIMDDIFGYDNFRNEIIWNTAPLNISGFRTLIKNKFAPVTSYILYYSKSINFIFNNYQYEIPDMIFNYFNIKGNDRYGEYRMSKWKQKIYLNNKSSSLTNIWNDILGFDYSYMNLYRKESVGYPNQKPEKLLKRIIKVSSNKNDLIADFFCGSGTALVIAKKLGRNFIGCDISEKAIEITNKRLMKKHLKGFLINNESN